MQNNNELFFGPGASAAMWLSFRLRRTLVRSVFLFSNKMTSCSWLEGCMRRNLRYSFILFLFSLFFRLPPFHEMQHLLPLKGLSGK
jgi:hypothetical protein